MTFIGKFLVFVVMILAIGAGVTSTVAYTQRPGWFNPIPDGGIEKGQHPASFPQMSAEIDALTRAAVGASNAYGADTKVLQFTEQLRATRRGKMFGPTGLLALAKTGEPKAFFDLKDDATTRLLNLDESAAVPIKGPDGNDLRGSETLLKRFNADADAIAGLPDPNDMMKLKGGLAQSITDLRAQQKQLGIEVLAMANRLRDQQRIRDALLNEADYLAAFEVNVAEQRDTVSRRRAQLLQRLVPFRPKK